MGLPLSDGNASPIATWHEVPEHVGLADDRYIFSTFKWNVHTQGRSGHWKYAAEIIHTNPVFMHPGTGKKLVEPSAAEVLDREWNKAAFEEAAVEFCRLFILNPAVPARAAAYEDKNSLEVAGRIQFMLDSGFLEVPERFRSLAPDHVALLLLVESSLEDADALQFKADNLAWLPEFSERLRNESKHALYRLVARILQAISLKTEETKRTKSGLFLEWE